MKDLNPLESLKCFDGNLPEFLSSVENKKEIKDLISKLKYSLEKKSEPSHAEQLENGKELIKYIITASIEYLSDKTNSPKDRAIGNITKYIDDFTVFEEMLFGLNKNYRDHTLHSLWVYLFGHQFINGMGGYEKFKIIGQVVMRYQKGAQPQFGVTSERLTCDKKHLEAMWGMIALLHDLGYPVETISNKPNEVFGSILDPFAIDFSSIFQMDLGSRINLLHQSVCDLLSAMYSPKDLTAEQKRELHEIADASDVPFYVLTEPTVTKSEPLEMEFRIATVNKRHSAWSVILAFKNIAYLHEGNKRNGTYDDFLNLMTKKDILYSLVHHTNEEPKDEAINRFAFILLLMDDIEEALRYSRGGKLRGIEVNRCDLKWDVGKDKTIIELDYRGYEKNGDEAQKKYEEISKKYKYQIFKEQDGTYEVEIKFISKKFGKKELSLYLGQDKGSAENDC